MDSNVGDWKCFLCHKVSHYRNLGDLYGPYYMDFADVIHAQEQKKKVPPTEGENHVQDFKPVPTCSATPQCSYMRQPQQSSGPPKAKRSRYSLLSSNYSPKPSTKREVWLHEDCIVWSDGVHIIGNQIRALDEVVKDSISHNCTACKTKGATIGCVGKRCRRKYHYLCAVQTDCLLNEEEFALKCDRCLANDGAAEQVPTQLSQNQNDCHKPPELPMKMES